MSAASHQPQASAGIGEADALLLALGTMADRLGRGSDPGAGKSVRAAYFAARLAERLGLGPSVAADAVRAALLHHLAADELHNELIAVRAPASYSQHGVAISSALAPFASLRGVATAVAFHEARWDGSGSPGLLGDAIPLAAQLVAAGDLADSAVDLCATPGGGFDGQLAADSLASAAEAELSSSVAQAAAALMAELQGAPQLSRPLAATQALLAGLPRFDGSWRELLCALAPCAEARNPYSRSHSIRTGNQAKAIARKLGLAEPAVERIEIAGWIHDIGELVVPAIVFRSAQLPPELKRAAQRHPEVSAEFCRGVPWLADLAPAVAAHHEKFDGSGYPAGLAGGAIPIEARILAVADACDAMTSEQVYRDGLGPQEIALDLRKSSKGAFDPEVVEAALYSVRPAP